MQQVNDYIWYKIYPKGVKDSVIEADITSSGIKSIYTVSKPNTKLLNGFIKKVKHLPKECDFKEQFIVYFIDYERAPHEAPLIDEDF